MSTATLPALGDVLGDRYTLMQRLAKGQYAIVFRARDRHSKIDVALKLPLSVAPRGAQRMLD